MRSNSRKLIQTRLKIIHSYMYYSIISHNVKRSAFIFLIVSKKNSVIEKNNWCEQFSGFCL